jgi:glycosyltransferase involved in cell wall biosynthesis
MSSICTASTSTPICRRRGRRCSRPCTCRSPGIRRQRSRRVGRTRGCILSRAARRARRPAGAQIGEPIENGVELAPRLGRKRDFALVLGRICPEKGIDNAIAAAGRAGIALLIAGTVFPYRDHLDYLHTRIVPRLHDRCRWTGAVGGRRKERLLAQARCLLVPSKVPETSSLVAMEAIAAGTPVIAYRAGALPEIVEDGRTGWIVDGIEEMAGAIALADRIDPEACRQSAGERFALERMTGAYLARYAELATDAAR